jgi:hypothetical protein
MIREDLGKKGGWLGFERKGRAAAGKPKTAPGLVRSLSHDLYR